MLSTTWIVLFALVLPGADDAEELNAGAATQGAVDDMSTRTRSIYANAALEQKDFPEVVEFKESPAPPVLPLGGNETRSTAFQQTAKLRSGRLCFLSYYVVDSPTKASEAIRRHVSNVSTPSQRVDDVRGLGLDGAEDIYVFDRAFGNECLLFRYDRLIVFLNISNDQQGDAARLRNSLAEAVLTRAKVVFGPGDEKGVETMRPVEVTSIADYDPLLLKESDFRGVRDFKQCMVLRTVLEGSLPRQRQVCIQEVWMPNGEQRMIEYLLCESPLEACAVMFHDALTVADPGRLLAVADPGPHSKVIQSLGGKEAVDDVYLFLGSRARDRASMMLRRNRLLMRIYVVNDPKNEAEATRDRLARALLARANDVFGNDDKNADTARR